MCVVKYESCDLVNFARIISGDSRLDLSKQLKSNMELYGIGKSDVDEEGLVFKWCHRCVHAANCGMAMPLQVSWCNPLASVRSSSFVLLSSPFWGRSAAADYGLTPVRPPVR